MCVCVYLEKRTSQMPISNGFSCETTNTPRTKPFFQPQIIHRAPKVSLIFIFPFWVAFSDALRHVLFSVRTNKSKSLKRRREWRTRKMEISALFLLSIHSNQQHSVICQKGEEKRERGSYKCSQHDCFPSNWESNAERNEPKGEEETKRRERRKSSMSQSYHQQFRDDQRNKNHRGVVFKSKAPAGNQLPPQRPTAVVKQPPRSNTFTLPKLTGETDSKVPKAKKSPNGAQRQPAKAKTPASISEPLETVRKPKSSMRQNGSVRSQTRPPNTTSMDQRKPVRFASNHTDTYYSSSPAPFPTHHSKSASRAFHPSYDTSDKSRSIRLTNDDYVIRRRKDPNSHAYTDHHRTVSAIPTISYSTSLPPITQPLHPTPPMIIIRPKETFQPEPPPFMPSISTMTSYPSNPFPFFPPPYPPNPNMSFPPPMMPGQPFLFPPTMDPNYFSQPYLYPIPFSIPPPPPPPLPAPVPQPTVVNQSSSSASASASVAAAAPVNYQTITEPRPQTIIVSPHTSTYDRKNVTIQLRMADEVCLDYFLLCSF